MDLTDPATVDRAMRHMTADERAEFMDLIASDPAIWRPQVGRQMEAMDSQADVIGYGGAAGGGKTDLIAGLALTEHKRALIMRREKTQTEGIIQRITEILGSSNGYNSQKSFWRIGDKLIEFGGLDNPNDHQKWQGRAHDLKALDEVTEMREHQARFVIGWNRSADAGQRKRVLMTFNPPTTVEGRWVIAYFGPWLDDKHPNPAKPGELRWFTTIKGKDMEVASGDPFVLFRGEPVYDFDPAEFSPEKIIEPRSRTFIPSRVTDNYFYVKSGYISTLQSMPEPLRSQMLNGDFMAGVQDDDWQVIPTEWIDAAMARWEDRQAKGPMDSMGADVAAGGKDNFVIARRHGTWFDKLIRIPGRDVGPDGRIGASHIIRHRSDQAPVHVDVIGWGAGVHTALLDNEVQSVAVNVSLKSFQTTADPSRQGFVNVRAQLIWRMREELDPANPDPIALHPDPALRADLAAYRWKPTPRGVQVRSKDEMKELLGRSPDDGDAVVLALLTTIRNRTVRDRMVAEETDRFAELH